MLANPTDSVPERDRRGFGWREWLAIGLPLTLVVCQAIFFWDFSIDDVGISWRYARHLADGQGLTWNLGGPPVEGYSNFLWVLMIAVPGAIGMDIELASKILGFVLMCGNILLFGILLRRLLNESRFWWVPLWIVAFAPEWTMWSMSGLEIAMFGTFLLVALFAFACDGGGRSLLMSFAFSGLVLTRPEGFAAAAIMLGVWTLLMRGAPMRSRWSRIRAPLLTLLITFGSLVAFRLWYFGYPLPNTVYAKISTFWHSHVQVLGWAWFVIPFVIASAVVFRRWGKNDPGIKNNAAVLSAIALAAAVAHTLMTLPVHPVMNFLHRYHVAFLPYLLLAVPTALDMLASRQRFIAVTTAAVLLVWSAQGWPAVLVRYDVEEYQKRVQRCIVDGLRELPGTPTIAIVDAGLIPYWTDLPTIDVWGLCDVEIAREKSRQIAVMKRAPDIYIMTVDSLILGFERPRTGDDKLMYQSGNFSQVYRLWRPCIGGIRPHPVAYDYAILVLARWARDNGVRIPERKEFRDTAPVP